MGTLTRNCRIEIDQWYLLEIWMSGRLGRRRDPGQYSWGVNRAPRTLALLTTLCLGLAGCGSGETPEQAPSAPATSAPAAGESDASSEVPAQPGGKQRSNPRLATLDVRNFGFRGGCGFEIPAGTVQLKDGKQAGKGGEVNGVRSTAEFSQQQAVGIAGTEYLLVQLSCDIGEEKVLGAHLIGMVDSQPTDLGIVATGTKITTRKSGGKLGFDTTYRTLDDEAGKASGAASYQIAMAGYTPVRIFDGQSADDLDPALEQLPAHGYDAGLVSINGYAEDESDATWNIGLLDAPGRVLTSESLGGGYEGLCWHSTIHTQQNEELGTTAMAFPGDQSQTGTVIDLAEDSEAEPGSRGEVALPVQKPISGLLIPVNGTVPTLATATTQTAGNPLSDPLVTTKAPGDDWLEIWRFGAASGNEYPLPFGAFATADGKIAMTGAWFNEPVDVASAGFGMRPIANADTVGEPKECS